MCLCGGWGTGMWDKKRTWFMSMGKSQGKSNGFGRGLKMGARGASRKKRLCNSNSGHIPERESPCDEKGVESYTHMHTHISLQVLGEAGSLQGAPDDVLGTPSPLRLMFIIKCPGCSNDQSGALDRGRR